MMAKKTLKELEEEVSILEEAARRKLLEKKLEVLKKENDFTLPGGEEVKMRKPKTRDMRLAEKKNTEAEKELFLMAALTGLTEAEIDDLDVDQYAVYQRKLKTFLY